MIWLVILYALLAIPAITWCEEAVVPSGEILTMEQAVTLALQNNLLVKNAVLDVEKTGDRISAARTKYLPVLDLSILESKLLTKLDFEFKKGSLGTFPSTGPIPAEDRKISTPTRWTTYAVVQAKQPISQLYQIGLQTSLLEVSQEISREKLRLQRQSTVNNVKHLYFGILQTQGSLDAVEETVKFLRELDRVIEDYVSQQAAMKYESIEVKARLSKAEYDAIALRNVLTTQKEQLNNLLGRDIRTDFRVSQLPSDILFEISIETAHTRALDKRPELKEARLKVKQAEYDRSIKKSEFIPDLSLTANHMRLYNVEMLPEKITTVGFILTWEFFDWGKKRAELAEKKKTIEQAVNGVKEAETQVLIDVNSRFRKLHESRSLLKTREIAMDGAKEKLRVMMNKYTQKAALLKDVLESQASLSDANRQYQEALLSFWTAKVDLEKAIGEE